MNHYQLMNRMFFFATALAATSCANMFGNSNGGLQVVPSSTTVGINQSMSFQAEGGTPPYTFGDSGVGSIDSSGEYNSGAAVGTSQVSVTDANGNMASATISVVNSSANVSVLQPSVQLKNGWTAASTSMSTTTPLVLGQLVGVDNRSLQSGESIHSKFMITNLRHPLVRMDELMEGKNQIAIRALVEDQFLVKLQQGYSASDLSSLLSSEGAHISKMISTGTYLVSMQQSGELNNSGVSSDFVAKRERLKRELQTIAEVTPHFLSRAPASVSGNGAATE